MITPSAQIPSLLANRTLGRAVCLVSLIVSMLSLMDSDASESSTVLVGNILEIKPPVTIFKPGEADGTPLKTSDAGKPLDGGERIECGPGGFALLIIDVKEVQLESGSKYAVPGIKALKQKRIARQIQELFRPAYSNRGSGNGPVLEPLNESSVWLREFTVRWDPRGFQGTVNLSFEDVAGREVWKATAPATSGIFKPDKAVPELGHVQQDSKPTEVLLRVSDGKSPEATVHFWLLSKTNDKELEDDLEAWNSAMPEENWMRHAGHASALAAREVFGEATRAIGKAVALSPNPTLRDAAIRLYHRVGDEAAVRQLRGARK